MEENMMMFFEPEEVDEEEVVIDDTSAAVVTNSVKMYLREIGQYDLLSQEEEYALAARKDAGDIEARNALVSANLRLVASMAKKYKGVSELSYQDLIQEGNIGLMHAADKFDYTKGYRFSTFASWWIKQTITRAISDKGRAIRLPAHVVENVSKMKQIRKDLTLALGHEPSEAQIAVAMKVSEEQIKDWMECDDKVPTSLDIKVGDDEDTTIGSFIEDTRFESPEAAFEKEDQKTALEVILDTLSEREASILKHRFGIGYDAPKTLEETGKVFNLTRERIRQIEDRALRKLRNPLREKMLREIM